MKKVLLYYVASYKTPEFLRWADSRINNWSSIYKALPSLQRLKKNTSIVCSVIELFIWKLIGVWGRYFISRVKLDLENLLKFFIFNVFAKHDLISKFNFVFLYIKKGVLNKGPHEGPHSTTDNILRDLKKGSYTNARCHKNIHSSKMVRKWGNPARSNILIFKCYHINHTLIIY